MSIQTWNDIDTTNTYWTGNGKYQDIYDKMIEAIKNEKWNWNKTTEKVIFRYYRFYNDGDCPLSMKYRVVDYSKLLEEKANERILKEWKRFKKGK